MKNSPLNDKSNKKTKTTNPKPQINSPQSLQQIKTPKLLGVVLTPVVVLYRI